MKYHGFIFNDMKSAGVIPTKSAGSYSISSICRLHGYNIKVIDNIMFIIENNFEQLKDYLDDVVSGDTIFFGFSTTFMDDPEKIRPLIDYLYFNHTDVDIITGGNGRHSWGFFDLYGDKISNIFHGISDNSILKYLKDSDSAPVIIEEKLYADEELFTFPNQQPLFGKNDTVSRGELLPLMVARGCRFKCKFCAFPFLGRLPTDDYVRTEKSLYDELLSNHENFNTKYYMISDDTFNETTDKLLRFKKVKDATSPYSGLWAYIRLELLERFPEQISILRDIGTKSIFFGLESLNYESAKSIGKGLPTDKVLRTLEKVKESLGENSVLHAGLIAGLPHETPETLEKWSSMIINKETAIDSISINGLGIYRNRGGRGTGIFSEFDENAEKYGYTLTDDLGGGPHGGYRDGWVNDTWTSAECSVFAQDINKKFYENNLDISVQQSAQSGMAIMNMNILDDKYDWNYMHRKFESVEDRKSFENEIYDGAVELNKKYVSEVFLT
jgi:radical SAM superfamily enzyme YgiQ (UPF0313 family)